MLFWFPLHFPEPDRLHLGLAEATGVTEPLALAIHLAHQGAYEAALLELRSAAHAGSPDLATLTRSALLAAQGKFAEAAQTAWAVAPFLTGHRAASVMTHLVAAHAHLHLGDPALAIHVAAQAADLATTPGSRHLRVPALTVRAAAHSALGDHTQGAAHARRALRLARTPLALFEAHLGLARTLIPVHPYEAFQHAHKALATAPAPALAAQAQRLIDTAFQAMKQGGPPGPPPSGARCPPHIHLQLLGAPALHLGPLRIDATRQARVIRLLCYLLECPDVSLATAAEALLPEGAGGRTKYTDEARRVARIRQDVNRARQLIGDPAAVTCQGSALRLGGGYSWSSDLQDAQHGNHPIALPPGLECDWLAEWHARTVSADGATH